MVIADILTELTGIYGVSIDTDTLIALVEKARKKISELFPALELSSTTTVADQTRYTIVKTDLIKIKQVFYKQGVQTTVDLFGDADVKSSMLDANSTFFPSQSFEFIARMKLLRDMFPMDAEIVSNDQFDLIPTPEVSGDIVYYEYAKYRTLAQIPEMFMDDICQLALYYYGEKDAQAMLLNPKGNKYNFERRGNITTVEGQNEVMQKSRKTQYDTIIKSIKDKVWGL